MRMALGTLKIARSEFWDMSFAEFWPIYNQAFGRDRAQVVTRTQYEKMKAW